MRHIAASLIVVFGSLSSIAAGQPTSPQPTAAQGASTLVSQEEESSSGERVRVSTPTMMFRSSADGTLGLRLECLHPVGSRPEPDRCIVYVVHTGRGPKYSNQHNTAFTIEADGKKVFESALSNFGANQDGANVVEPLVGFWAFPLIKTLSEANELTFVLAGERMTVATASVAALREIVKYFSTPAGV